MTHNVTGYLTSAGYSLLYIGMTGSTGGRGGGGGRGVSTTLYDSQRTSQRVATCHLEFVTLDNSNLVEKLEKKIQLFENCFTTSTFSQQLQFNGSNS